MKYLHKEFSCAGGETVRVDLDGQANVSLLDESNYQQYRRGGRHRYYGGLAKKTPVLLTVPSPGRWHVVVDLGGYTGHVSASIALLN
jgi:hypothetical protein